MDIMVSPANSEHCSAPQVHTTYGTWWDVSMISNMANRYWYVDEVCFVDAALSYHTDAQKTSMFWFTSSMSASMITINSTNKTFLSTTHRYSVFGSSDTYSCNSTFPRSLTIWPRVSFKSRTSTPRRDQSNLVFWCWRDCRFIEF